MAKRDNKIRMQSTESAHYYTMVKPHGTEKLELMRYDPFVRRHVLYVEKKISK